MFAEEGQFFCTTAVEIRIALLEAQDMLALFQSFKPQAKQFFLRCISIARKLASYLHDSAAWDKIQHACWNKLVSEDEVRRLDRIVCRSGEEVGVARP